MGLDHHQPNEGGPAAEAEAAAACSTVTGGGCPLDNKSGSDAAGNFGWTSDAGNCSTTISGSGSYGGSTGVSAAGDCQTVIANEYVVDGHCERCGAEVELRNMTQWYFRTTAYADELLEYPGAEWPERTMTIQRNWLGRSEGASGTRSSPRPSSSSRPRPRGPARAGPTRPPPPSP